VSAVLLLPQPLKTEHPKAPNPKTPVAMQMQYSNYKKKKFRNNKLFIESKKLTY
jgi:hypothetical protein